MAATAVAKVLQGSSLPSPKERVLEYLSEYETYLNRHLGRLGVLANGYAFRFYFDTSYLEKGQFSSIVSAIEERDEQGNLVGFGDGHLWEETVETVLSVLWELLQGRVPLIVGNVQSSKSASQALAGMLFVLIRNTIHRFEGHGEVRSRAGDFTHVLFMSPPGRLKYLKQFGDKAFDLYEVMQYLRVELIHGKRSFHSGLFDTLVELQNRVRCRFPDRGRDSTKTFNKGYAGMKFPLPCVTPASSMRAFLEDYSSVCTVEMDEKPVQETMVIFRDESHAAQLENSQNSKLFEEFFYDHISRRQFIYVPTSATPYNTDPDYHVPCPVVIGPGWRGVPTAYWKDGRLVPNLPRGKKLDEVLPTILSAKHNFFDVNKDFGYAHPASFASQAAYDKQFEKRGFAVGGFRRGANGYANYRRRIAAACGDVIVHLLDQAPSERSGVLLRFINNNGLMAEFCRNLERHFAFEGVDIAVVPEFGKGNRDLSVKDMLNRLGIKRGQKYVIVATAGARMSDTFRQDCAFGIDLTSRSEFVQAIEQGVLGRISGYGKDPTIVLSEENYAALQNHIDQVLRRGVPPERRPSDSVERTENHRSGVHLAVERDEFQELEPLFAFLENPKTGLDRKFDQGDGMIRGGKYVRGDFRDVISLDRIAEIIEGPIITEVGANDPDKLSEVELSNGKGMSAAITVRQHRGGRQAAGNQILVEAKFGVGTRITVSRILFPLRRLTEDEERSNRWLARTGSVAEKVVRVSPPRLRVVK